MANIPNQVTLTVTNAEVAAELEALALAYEDTVQKLRYEADRLRQGFTLTLDVRATQVHMAPTPEPEVMEGVCGDTLINPEPERGRMKVSHPDMQQKLKPTTTDQPVKNLPDDAIKLIDSMTDNKGEEE